MDSGKWRVSQEKIAPMRAYLSGAMEYAGDGGTKWREGMTSWLLEELGHPVVNPVVESHKLTLKYNAHNYRQWKESEPERYAEFIRHCVNRDLEAIAHEVDYVICLWNEGVFKGAGTHGEVTMAYSRGIPVYLVNRIPLKDLSGWIMACSTKIFGNFGDMKNYLVDLYT